MQAKPVEPVGAAQNRCPYWFSTEIQAVGSPPGPPYYCCRYCCPPLRCNTGTAPELVRTAAASCGQRQITHTDRASWAQHYGRAPDRRAPTCCGAVSVASGQFRGSTSRLPISSAPAQALLSPTRPPLVSLL